ncbi:hypothetical protein V5O48_017944 [Marasmius crinis-equi]|uniref:Uncharacterized protein n=1 Tax=Marasmius crinis-equi TaxID=585013 RepID=A0ABR3EML9_9AGAR
MDVTEDSEISGWDIILEYARSPNWTHPMTEKKLEEQLGNRYQSSNWTWALFAVTGAENTVDALLAVEKLMPKSMTKSPSSPPSLTANTEQLTTSKNELREAILELHKRGHLPDLPDIDQLLNPPLKRADSDSVELNFSEGEKGLEEIRDFLKRKLKGDSEEEDPEEEVKEEPPFELDAVKALEAA